MGVCVGGRIDGSVCGREDRWEYVCGGGRIDGSVCVLSVCV